MKKKYTIIIILLLIGLIGFYVYYNMKYSLENILKLLPFESGLPNNAYIEEEHFDNVSEKVDLKVKTYIKDNIVYIYQDGKEQLYNFNNGKLLFILHASKEITYFSIGELDKEYILTNGFNYEGLKEYTNQYKYLGKEKIDDKIYIKFSITGDNIKEIYYLDVENKYISKIENYRIDNNEYKLETTINYKYLYNVVKDEDILKFDSDNYPDYIVQGEINE